MCVSTCPCRANTFGDPDDKESLIYKTMKGNKLKVLSSVRTEGQAKMTFSQLKEIKPEDLSKKIGYPGQVPVFADSANTKPRVFYILP